MAILPPLFSEVQSLILKAPQYIVQAAARVQPLIEPLREKLGLPTLSLQDLQADATQWAGQVLAVAGSVAGGLRRLFMSHPPLDERIAALRALGSPLSSH